MFTGFIVILLPIYQPQYHVQNYCKEQAHHNRCHEREIEAKFIVAEADVTG